MTGRFIGIAWLLFLAAIFAVLAPAAFVLAVLMLIGVGSIVAAIVAILDSLQ